MTQDIGKRQADMARVLWGTAPSGVEAEGQAGHWTWLLTSGWRQLNQALLKVDVKVWCTCGYLQVDA